MEKLEKAKEGVDVITRSGLDEKAHKWSSDGKSGYELEETTKEGRGTQVVLHLGEGNHELLEDWKVRELIKKYSNYVAVPIMMLLGHVHSSIEWTVSYNSLLFIPEQTNAFADMRDPNKDYGPKLYVQNVLILEHAKELLPVWLRFVSWVVETTDLPLNISREMLQSNATLETIKKNYWAILKEWVYYEADLKEDIAQVLEFRTRTSDKKVSLDEYLEKVSGEEKTIYYVTGKSVSEVLASPYMAQFVENNVDVLLLTDVIDEWMIGVLDEYKWAKLKSITASDIKLKEETEEDKKKAETNEKQFKDMLELVKNTIGIEKIEKVELNPNLGDALWALKTPDGAMNPQMEKMMKAMGQPVPETKRVLELNPNNKLVKAMKKEFKADVKSRKLKDLTNYAYMQAILLASKKDFRKEVFLVY